MNSLRPLLKVSSLYGVVAGFLGASLAISLFYLGKHPFLLPVILDFRIILFGIFIFFALREFRDFQNGGVLFFWQGFISSYLFVFIAGMVGAVTLGAFAAMDEKFVSEYISVLIRQMTDFREMIVEKVGKEAFEQQLAKLPLTTGWDLAAHYFLKSLIIGFFLTVLISVVVRRHPVSEERA